MHPGCNSRFGLQGVSISSFGRLAFNEQSLHIGLLKSQEQAMADHERATMLATLACPLLSAVPR